MEGLQFPRARLSFGEFHRRGTGSKDPYPAWSTADAVRNTAYCVSSMALKRLLQRGVDARACYSISPIDYFLETSKND